MSLRIQGPNLTKRDVEHGISNGIRYPLVIYGHTCMGDHIICCGMYRILAQKWQINIMARPGHHDNICMMLQGIDDAYTIEIPEEHMAGYCNGLKNTAVLRFGYASGEPFDRWNFDTEFYRQVGIDFIHRWESFHVPEVEQLPIPGLGYTFVHERPEFFNARLDIPGERPRAGHSIFAHRNIILYASQLHCVSSAFAAFADCFDLTGIDLHFYPFGREIPKHMNNWKIHS